MTDKEIVHEYDHCKSDYWYYLTTYYKTIDKDTGEVKPFATFNGKYDRPEYRDVIHVFLDKVHERRIAKRQIKHPDIADEKSRQMYVTNSIMGYITWCLLFVDYFRGLATHEKEDKLDSKVDFNTPFGMIDFGLEHNPPWLKPDKNDIIRSHMTVGLKSRNSLLTGDAGLRPGAGGGYDLIYNTEFAHQSFTNSKLAAEREACKGVNILDSTPNGENNEHAIVCSFAEKNPDLSSFEYVPLLWKLRRTDEWYAIKKRDYNGDDVMIAQELDMSRKRSLKGRVFSSFIQSQHVIDYVPGPLGITCAGWDFGVGAPTVFVIATIKNDETIVIDSFFKSGSTPHEIAIEFKNKCRLLGILPEKVIHIGDPSGDSQPRESALYEPSFKLFRNEGILIRAGNNRILEGIQTINGLFFNNKLKISSKCTVLIDALNKAVFPTDSAGNVTKEAYTCDHPMIDHLDALKYVIRYMASMMTTRPRPASRDFMGYVPGSSKPDSNQII